MSVQKWGQKTAFSESKRRKEKWTENPSQIYRTQDCLFPFSPSPAIIQFRFSSAGHWGFRVLTLYHRNAEGSICILPVSRTTTYARSIIVFPIWQMRWKSLRLNSLSKTHRRQGMPLGLDPGMPDNDVIPLGTTVPFCLLSSLWKRA